MTHGVSWTRVKQRVRMSSPEGQREIISSVVLILVSTGSMAVLFLCLGRMMQSATENTVVTRTQLIIATVAPIVAGLAAALTTYVTGKSATTEEQRQRDRVLRHIMALGPVERNRQRTGKLTATVTEGLERVALYRQTFLGPMVASLLVPACVLIIVGLVIDPLSAWILAACLPCIPLSIIGFGLTLRTVSSKSRDARNRLAARFLDAIQGLATIRILGAAPKVAEELANTGEENRRNTMKLLAGNQLVLFIVDAVFSLFMISVAAWLAMWRLSSHHIDLGGAISLVLLSTLLLAPLEKIGQFFYVGMGGLASQRGVKAILRQPVAMRPHMGDASSDDKRPEHAKALLQVSVSDDGIKSTKSRTRKDILEARSPVIEVSHVAFDYENQPVLTDINMTIASGEHVALVGRSGSGKSTLLSLLRGHQQPSQGQIHLLGKPVVGSVGLAAVLGVVSQKTWLFTGTVEDNLRFAAPDATDKQLWDALRAAHLDKDISRMPQGMRTPIGERGLSLSGGQAQRLSIARVILTEAPILVFDEPTAHVDLESEEFIFNAIEELSGTRTLLTITHRETLIRHADRVLTLDEGKLIPFDTNKIRSETSHE